MICNDCDTEANENFAEHGDELFPPSPCRTCGGETGAGACIMLTVCPTCAARDGVCEACGEA